MRLAVEALLVLLFLLSQVSCATIVSGRNESVKIVSIPSSAQVQIDETRMGVTPLITEIKRGQDHEVVIRKEGYITETRTTRQSFNWWLAGNLILWQLPGFMIDWADGAAFCVDPNPIQVTLLEEPVPKKPAVAPVDGDASRRSE